MAHALSSSHETTLDPQGPGETTSWLSILLLLLILIREREAATKEGTPLGAPWGIPCPMALPVSQYRQLVLLSSVPPSEVKWCAF